MSCPEKKKGIKGVCACVCVCALNLCLDNKHYIFNIKDKKFILNIKY